MPLEDSVNPLSLLKAGFFLRHLCPLLKCGCLLREHDKSLQTAVNAWGLQKES